MENNSQPLNLSVASERLEAPSEYIDRSNFYVFQPLNEKSFEESDVKNKLKNNEHDCVSPKSNAPDEISEQEKLKLHQDFTPSNLLQQSEFDSDAIFCVDLNQVESEREQQDETLSGTSHNVETGQFLPKSMVNKISFGKELVPENENHTQDNSHQLRIEEQQQKNILSGSTFQIKLEKEDDGYLLGSSSHQIKMEGNFTVTDNSSSDGNPFCRVDMSSELIRGRPAPSFSLENSDEGTSQQNFDRIDKPESWEEMIQDMNKKLERTEPGLFSNSLSCPTIRSPTETKSHTDTMVNMPVPPDLQQRSPTGGKLYYCPVCNRSFKTTSSLRNHIRTHTGEKPHECSICQKAFSQSSNLITHMRIHTGDKPHQCAVCKKSFNTVSDLKHHMSIHTGIKPLECSVCKKGFNTNYKLKIHMRSHTGEKPHICSLCETAFTRSYDLKIHIRTHTGEKDHTCSICNKAFSRRYELTSHMRTHTGEKPYRCKVCEKCFAESGSLANHTKIHTGEMPYMCGVCNKAFHHSSNLKRHMRSHIGEKPHLCTECDKAFNTTSDLKRHMEIHTGDKNYECLICFKAFRRSDHLKKHVKTHALDKKPQAPVEQPLPVPENLSVNVSAV